MHEMMTIYLPAAVASRLIAAFLGRYAGYKNLLHLGIYCIVVPVLTAIVAGGIGRWTVVILNSLALLIIGLVLWLSFRKRVSAEGKVVDDAVAD